MTKGELASAGQAIFGRRWQSAMARWLAVDVRTVQRWASGKVAVPGIVEQLLKMVLAVRTSEDAVAAQMARVAAAAKLGQKSGSRP